MTYISTTKLSEMDVNVLGLFFCWWWWCLVLFVLWFFFKGKNIDISIYIPKGVFGKLTILISNK